MLQLRPISAIAACLFAITLQAGAALKPVVAWSVKNAPTHPVKPGAKFDVTVAGKIEPGWHLYALEEPSGGPIATEVALVEGDPAELLRVTGSKPHPVRDPAFGMQTDVFTDAVAFTLHLRAPSQAAQSTAKTVHVLVRYQSCNDQVCRPPHTDTIEVPLS